MPSGTTALAMVPLAGVNRSAALAQRLPLASVNNVPAYEYLP